MVIIKDLKELPKNCLQCPCFHPATMDGPPYCSIKVLLTHSYFDSIPNIHECPLEEVSED